VKLDFTTLSLQLTHTWTISRSSPEKCSQVLVITLVDDDGLVGFGETAPIARYHDSIEQVGRFLARIDPNRLVVNDIGFSFAYLSQLGSPSPATLAALSTALLDLAGKQARKTIHQLLGLPFHENRYRTSFSIGIDHPDVIRQKVLAAEPFPVLKLKLGSAMDRSNLRALREVAPSKPVRVDANEAWKTREQALQNIEWLAGDGGIEFVEQPMPASAPLKDWVWLKQRSPLPIIADESFHLAGDVNQAADCFHGVNVKLVKTGGIPGALDALRAARAAGLKTMLGCMIESSILISAAAHLADLCDYLDLDGNLLITNDPYSGVTARNGILSFADAPEKFGVRVAPRAATDPA
jgi:L-Ala-D/L-Glu epimerase